MLRDGSKFFFLPLRRHDCVCLSLPLPRFLHLADVENKDPVYSTQNTFSCTARHRDESLGAMKREEISSDEREDISSDEREEFSEMVTRARSYCRAFTKDSFDFSNCLMLSEWEVFCIGSRWTRVVPEAFREFRLKLPEYVQVYNSFTNKKGNRWFDLAQYPNYYFRRGCAVYTECKYDDEEPSTTEFREQYLLNKYKFTHAPEPRMFLAHELCVKLTEEEYTGVIDRWVIAFDELRDDLQEDNPFKYRMMQNLAVLGDVTEDKCMGSITLTNLDTKNQVLLFEFGKYMMSGTKISILYRYSKEDKERMREVRSRSASLPGRMPWRENTIV